jgi:N-methylhydantoinase A
LTAAVKSVRKKSEKLFRNTELSRIMNAIAKTKKVARWRLGIDIGGTFTDAIAYDPATQQVATAKVRTRVGDPLAGLRAALAALGLVWDDIAVLVHGTTLVTNAIVEGRLPPVALITTKGFADVLEIGRQNRRSLYDLDSPPKLPSMVPESLRFELDERVAANGEIHVPLQPSEIKRVADLVRKSGVASVAVSLLHSYTNPTHERLAGEYLAGVVPYVSLSHRVNPEEREYERTAATVLNAAAIPVVGKYLDEIDREVSKSTNFTLFHSAGGMASSAMVRERPLVLALSGPAAGVSAACQVARDLNLDNVLTLDMGGTTTDVCLIRNGKPERRREASLADRPIRQTMVAVQSIGAGGGSIAYVEAGMLRVGPQSAGANPGPACYGLGNLKPTVTDANLLLGYLDAKKPLADGVRLDLRLAEEAIGRLATELQLTPVETAIGIVRVANANMIRAIRNVTVDRGIDGRQCTLVAFGGAGPLHAATLARDFGIGTVVVPAYSSAYSALGCAVANLSYTQQRTVRVAKKAWTLERMRQLRDDLLADIKFEDTNVANLIVEDIALMRYIGQSYSVEVPYSFPHDAQTLTRDFRSIHEHLYGFSTEEDWEIEAIRVTAFVSEPANEVQLPAYTEKKLAPRATTNAIFSAAGPVATARYLRDVVTPGAPLAGPAIIEDEWSTITIPPGATIQATERGHLVMNFEAAQ